MKKDFRNMTRLMLASVALAGVCSFSASAADAGKKCVYLVGNTGVWNPPLTAYEDTFTPIYETTPGSNVYQGTVYFTDNQWFRFNSGLEEGQPDNYDTSAWQRHYIGPALNEERIPEIGKSGVYFTNDVANEEVLSPNAEYGSWHMPISGNILLTLDLNENSLTAVSADYPIVCINSTTKPTYNTLANFRSVLAGSQYVPSGKAEIYLYDFALDTWLSPKGSTQLDANSLTVLRRNDDLVASSTPKALQFSNWQGGIVNISAFDGRINISAEKDQYDLKHDANSMYVVTDGTSIVPWSGAPDGPFYRVTELKYVSNGPNSYWEGTVNMPQYGFRLNIISELGSNPESNRYLVPDGTHADKELNFVNGFAFSNSSPATADNANIYWTYGNFKGGDVKITVSEKDGKVSFNYTDASLGEIYVIGQDQGWDINKGTMPLKLTDKGGYYGSHYISAGAFFRFYTQLGDWESHSLGTQVDDSPVSIDFSGPEASYGIVNGKGSFNVSSWGGGLLYIYVEPETYRVTFSASPISWAGDIVESSDVGPVQKGVFYSDNYFYKQGMKKLSDGVYSTFITSMYDQPVELRLFAGNYGVTPDDSEWYSAYAISIDGDLTMDLAKSEYQEFDIAGINEAIDGNKGNTIKIVNEKYGMRHCEVVVDLNKNKVYIAPMDYLFLLKEGDPEPHANNWLTTGYDKVPLAGGVVRIGGEFDYMLFWPRSEAKFSWPSQPDVVIDFKDNLLQGAKEQYDFSNKRVKINDWVDGDLVVTYNCILDLQHLQKVKVYTANTDGTMSISELERISWVDPLFKGTVKYEDYAVAYNHPQVMEIELARTTVAVTDYYNETYSIRATPEYCFNSFFLGQSAPVDNIIEFPGGRASTKVSTTGENNFFLLPTLIGGGELEVTLHLGDGDVNIEKKSGATKDPISLVSNNPDFCATLYPTSKDTHNHTAHITIKDRATNDFYLRTADYQFLIPASGKDVDLEPDYNGYVELPFTLTSAPSAKWYMPSVEADNFFDILVDFDAKVLKVHSSGHNTGFFIHAYPQDSYLDDQIALYNFEERGGNWMREERNGIYSGTASVRAGETHIVSFSKTLTAYNGHGNSHGIAAFYSQDNYNVDLTGGKTYETYAWDQYTFDGVDHYYFASGFYVTTDKPYIKADYNANTHKLTFTGAESGVDEIVADENKATFTIIPGTGNVTVTAQAETILSFYNLSGIAVKTVTVPAGQSTVDLPSGFYIAAGKKLVVR